MSFSGDQSPKCDWGLKMASWTTEGRPRQDGLCTVTWEPPRGLEQRSNPTDGRNREAWGASLRQRGDMLIRLLPLPPDFYTSASSWQGSTKPSPGRGRQGAWACGRCRGRMTDAPWVVPVQATTAGLLQLDLMARQPLSGRGRRKWEKEGRAGDGLLRHSLCTTESL
jgi:hypothetical protein